jgi:uncharacterized protein YbjT (DUF2867 family)
MSSTTIAVTGATGRLGGRVARLLTEAGVAQLLLVRDPSRAPRLQGAEVVHASYGDRETVRRALAGVSTVFMVSAAETPDRVALHRSFVDAAADAGVAHLVYTSFYGAGPEATFTLARDHWATEEHLRAGATAFTVLRDNLYADFVPALVAADGAIRGPGGDGRVSFVAQDDIADAATAVLLDRSPGTGRTYDLTGPEDLTLADAAAVLTEVTGRHVRYEPETLEQAYASRAGYGAPPWQVDAWVSTYTAIACGELAGVSTAIADLTGHPPTSLAEVLGRP